MKKITAFGLTGLSLLVLSIGFLFNQTNLVSAKSSSSDVNLTVKVLSLSSLSNLQKPHDHQTIPSHLIPVSLSYQNANNISYTLSYKNEHGTTTTLNLLSLTPSSANGTHNWQIDLKALGLSYGEYILQAKVSGHGVSEDSVSFKYVPITVNLNQDPTGQKPSITIKKDANTDYVEIQILDPEGKPLLSPARKESVAGSSTSNLPINLANFCPKAGSYTVLVTAFDASGNKLASPVAVQTVLTCPNTSSSSIIPNVPNTGSFLSKAGLSRVDSIVSSLIIFALVSCSALFVLRRRSQKQ